jgi:pSer/pThr/pTyr-binding forkhead associated (FHA) protein
VITCPKCSKDNQDHYKFCLGCGAELPRGVAPKPFSPQTPPHGMRAVSGAPATVALSSLGGPSAGALGGTVAISQPPGPLASPAAAPRPSPVAVQTPPIPATAGPTPAPPPFAPPPVASPPFAAPPWASPPLAASASASPPLASSSPLASAPTAAAGGATVVCPQCGHVNSPSNLFCGSCGFRLGGAPRPAVPSVVVEADTAGMVLTALRADGSEAGTFQLPDGGGVIGRETGGIFAGDSYLSPRHANFRVAQPGRASVKDDGSLNGVYKRLPRDLPTELKPNDIFRIGQEIIKYEPLSAQAPSPDGVERLGAPSKGYVGRIALVIGREETGNAFPIPESGVHLGRERGDILFPEDGYVSGLHCRLSWDGRRLFLTDLGSSNGTFLRVGETELRPGDVLLMGQQLFRIAV